MVIGTEATSSSLRVYLWSVKEGSARANLARALALRKVTTVRSRAYFALRSRRMMRARSCALCSALLGAVSGDQSFLWPPLYARPRSSSVLDLDPRRTDVSDSTDSAELFEAGRSSANDSEGYDSSARARVSRTAIRTFKLRSNCGRRVCS